LNLNPKYIAEKLAKPLPGLGAQQKMAPRTTTGIPDRGSPPETTRQSGVILLLFNRGPETEIVLTLRSHHLQYHGNQISLPGGKREEGENTVQTALRETQEEIGIDPAAIEILGLLTPLHVPVSSNVICPVVGWLDRPPRLVPDYREVAEAFTLPLHRLLDPGCRKKSSRELRGMHYDNEC
jgi:8-oxo-dGTP pyrophosphatase MutT (NUDIX family)